MTARLPRGAFLIALAVTCLIGNVALGASDPAADGGHSPAASAEEPNPLAVDPDLAIWTAVIFVLLLLVLGKFAWPPIMQALDEREKGIADNIAAAEAKHVEAKELLTQYEARLASAAEEVRELLDEARRDAEHTKTQIVNEARQAAQAEHDRSMRDVQQATDVAMKQLAEKSASLAIELAGKVVGDELTQTHQDRLVREALGKLAASPSEN